MDYRHYFGESFIYDRERIYPLDTKYKGFYFKPNGFWFSIGDSWEKWCLCKDYKTDNIKKYLKINIGNPKTLLFLNEDNIDRFLKQFSYARYFDNLLKTESFKISWDEVKSIYNGIVIDKEDDWLYSYGYSLGRFPSNFLEAWDCLSGVVWNLKGAKVEVDPMPCLAELINED